MFELLDLEIIRIVLSLLVLGVAVFFDILKRQVHDIHWIAMGALSGILLLFEPDVLEKLVETGIALIVFPVALLLWRIGVFGAADFLGIVALAAIFPQLTISENMVTPLTIISNSVLFSAMVIFYNIIINTISILKRKNIFAGFEDGFVKRVLAFCFGHVASNPKFGYIMEETIHNHKRFVLSLHHVEKSKFTTQKNVWIMPGMPFLAFIFCGYLLQIFYGDLILGIFKLIM